MTDLKNLCRQNAAQFRQLAEIETDPKLKERLLETAALLEAKVDEDKDDNTEQ